jgi:hypothetical protein
MAAMDAKLTKSLKIEDEANMVNFDKVCARSELALQMTRLVQLQLEHDSPRYTLLLLP